VLAELGAGACGTVSKVAHRRTGEVYALKVIERGLVEEHRLQHYVEREASTQRMLDHPNVVKLIDSFEDSQRVYLLLEYAPGGQLFSKIRRRGFLSEEEAATIFVDIAGALAHLHRHSIAHRDVKPENVLLFPGGRAKLADFGWCAELKPGDVRSTFCGTMDYLSPEMVSRDKHDHRVDTWACGVLLYEMLTGEPPFHARSPAESLDRIMAADLRPPSSMPEGAQGLVKALLRASAAQRLPLEEALRWPWLLEKAGKQLSAQPSAGSRPPSLPPKVPTEMSGMLPRPKSSSRGGSAGSGRAGAGPSVSDSSPAKAFFGSALRPCSGEWAKPQAAESSGEPSPRQEEGPFLLSSCLEPVSGLLDRRRSDNGSAASDAGSAPTSRGGAQSTPRQGEVPRASGGSAGSWAETQTFTAVRSWVRQDAPLRILGKELDRTLAEPEAGLAKPAQAQRSTVSSAASASRRTSLISASEYSAGGADADASTDVEDERSSGGQGPLAQTMKKAKDRSPLAATLQPKASPRMG